jgi:hypothetical protein
MEPRAGLDAVEKRKKSHFVYTVLIYFRLDIL